jgi:hypothetical protein
MILEGLVSHCLNHFDVHQCSCLLQQALDESFWGENNELSGILIPIMLAVKDMVPVHLLSFCQLVIKAYCAEILRIFHEDTVHPPSTSRCDLDKLVRVRKDNMSILGTYCVTKEAEWVGHLLKVLTAAAHGTDTSYDVKQLELLRELGYRLVHRLVPWVQHNVSVVNGLSLEDCFQEPARTQFDAYIASVNTDPNVFSAMSKSYFLLGYMVHHRLTRGMQKHGKVPKEFVFSCSTFLAQTFYTLEEKVEAFGDLGEVVGFTRQFEQSNGLHYAREGLFLFYSYVVFLYSAILKPSMALLFQAEKPVEAVRRIIANSTEAKTMLRNSCPLAISMSEVHLMFLFDFIVKGVMNTCTKDLFCRRLKGALGAQTGNTIRVSLSTEEHNNTSSKQSKLLGKRDQSQMEGTSKPALVPFSHINARISHLLLFIGDEEEVEQQQEEEEVQEDGTAENLLVDDNDADFLEALTVNNIYNPLETATQAPMGTVSSGGTCTQSQSQHQSSSQSQSQSQPLETCYTNGHCPMDV